MESEEKEATGTSRSGFRPSVYESGDVTVRGKAYEGAEGLREPLTKTNRSLVMYDMTSHNHILEPTSGYFIDNKRYNTLTFILRTWRIW